MSTAAPEKVFPAPDAPSPAPGAGKNPLAKIKGLNPKVLWGGAALVVVVLASTVGKAKPAEDADGAPFTIDTTGEDIDTRLSDLEDAITDRPRPVTPTAPAAGTPTGPAPSPVPGGNSAPGTTRGTYRVKAGDTLTSVAKVKKVKGGATRLYAHNRNVIKAAAIAHHHPNPTAARKLYAGTVLVIPK